MVAVLYLSEAALENGLHAYHQAYSKNLYNVLFSVSGLVCFCDPCVDSPASENETCIAKPNTKCFASVRLKKDHEGIYEIWTYGCLPPDNRTLNQVSIMHV